MRVWEAVAVVCHFNRAYCSPVAPQEPVVTMPHFSLFLLASAVEDMSEEDLKEKALGSAKLALGGKTELERTAVLHQHIGSRAMGDMVIETFGPNPGKIQAPYGLPGLCNGDK